MAVKKSFDLVIIGAGPGGYVGAIRAAQLGMKVALVDKNREMGGTCLNVGCIPSKALLESSELYYTTQHSVQEHGVVLKDVKLDLKKMLGRKQAIVKQLVGGVATLLKERGIDVHQGHGRIAGHDAAAGHRVQITGEDGKKTTLNTEHIIIATGSIPVELPFLPFDFKTIVTSTQALSFKQVPQKLAIIGAGAIGLEMGSIWTRLGAEVTVIELLPQIVPGWDVQISRRLAQLLKKQGMRFMLNTRVEGALKKGDTIHLKTAGSAAGKTATVEANKVLVAVGRKPFHEGVGIEENGIEWDRTSGFIKVDKNFQTSVQGVFAIGDVIPGPMLAHKASEEGVACVERLAGIKAEVNYHTIPNVIYTSPEVASVGKTQEQLAENGTEFNKGLFNYRANGRALALGETEGFVKILADRKTDEIIGIHIIGPRASDLISEAVSIMEFKGSSEDIARIVHAHPTLPEVMKEAALAVHNRAIHSL
jgi:dihydrolipoamide dehydrogenase